MKTFLLICLMFLFPACVISGVNQNLIDQETQQELDAKLPPILLNEQDVIQHRCFFKCLKKVGDLNVIGTAYVHRIFWICVYEKNNKGQWVRKDQLRITAFINPGKLEVVDLFGKGISFLKIIAEGNEGTGVYQTFLIYAGWHVDKFVPVLMETNSFYCGNDDEIGPYMQYIPSFKLEDPNTPRVTVVMDVHYKVREHSFYEGDDEKHSHDLNIDDHWTEKLIWNEKNFSFYDEEDEKGKMEHVDSAEEMKDIKARINFLKNRLNLYNYKIEDLEELGFLR